MYLDIEILVSNNQIHICHQKDYSNQPLLKQKNYRLTQSKQIFLI